ncbi:extracellular solute-binding protein [Leifsonia xyli]|uniref:extracellular solute-binding protein n=1 Tax=Leifsonia xyli TaxID=1575 RepID=UPI00031F18E6|nr:extracellular solute-binding protein [Leifsonia xyli]
MAYGLYYNKKMFADAGLEPPASWEELIAAGKKLTAGGVHGLVLTAGAYTTNSHFAFIDAAQNGADLFDKSGRPTFADDAVVDGVLRYLDLMQSARIVDPADAQKANTAESVSVFARGEAAMMIMQNNASSTVLANGVAADAFGVVPFPAPAGAKPIASHVAGINVSVFKNTKHKDAALKLVDYLTSEKVQARLGAEYSTLPVLTGMEPAFKGDPAQAAVFQRVYETMAKPLPLVPAEDQYEATVGKAMNDLFARIATGSTVRRDDVKKALQTAQDDVAASLG